MVLILGNMHEGMDKLVDFTQRQLIQAVGILRSQPTLSLMLGMLVLAIAMLTAIKTHVSPTGANQAAANAEQVLATPTKQQPQQTTPLPLAEPTDALAEQSKLTTHTIHVAKGDNLATIFKALKLSPAQLVAINNLGTVIDPLRNLHPGQALTISIDNSHQLAELILKTSAMQQLVIERSDGGFNAKTEALPLEQKLNFVHGAIENSYYDTAAHAGLNNQQIYQLSQIFKNTIDFHKLRKGDRFSALYEGYYSSEGKLVKQGNIVAAEFTHNGKTEQAIRFSYPQNHTGYYTPQGKSYKIAISRAPLNYSHISSYFGSRYHPLLHFTRMHEGVDYAASHGTTIHAAGDGVITYLGRKGGYGRIIFIQHDKTYSTRYAHMSNYAKGLKRGSRVQKGQAIGYVGASGLATGPHLHFEIRVNGVAKNPLTVALPDAQPIPKAYALKFKARAQQLMEMLATHTQSINSNA